MRVPLLLLAASTALVAAACAPAPDEQAGATSTSELSTTNLVNWKQWFPFDRGQAFGERFTTSWQTAPGQNAQGDDALTGGQSTYRLPIFDSPGGVPSNRPNASLPADYARAGFVNAHRVNYFFNWWCDARSTFVPGSTNVAQKCLIPIVNGLDAWHELDSETDDGRYLETWGMGDQANWSVLLKDAMCTNPALRSSPLSADRFEPLLWGMPAAAGIAQGWVGPSSCMRTYTNNYSTISTAGRVFIAAYQRSMSRDADSPDLNLLEAVNGFYQEIEPSIPGGQTTKTGARCMSVATYNQVPYARDNTGATVPMTRGDNGFASCLVSLEHYWMRRVDAGYRRYNGFGSWQIVGEGWSNPPLAGGNQGWDWNQAWQSTKVAPHQGGYFWSDRCTLVNGLPKSCS